MQSKKSQVYFISSRPTSGRGLLQKLDTLIDRVKPDFIKKDELVAIKLHWGEEGSTTYIRPIYVRKIVDKVKKYGGKPFLTDSNVLYKSKRMNAVDNIELAIIHGFDFANVGAPIIVADGIRSDDFVEVEVNLKHFKTIKYGSAAHYADSLIVVSHFKGHMVSGFGGAIKNVGMGLGSRSAKQQMHAVVKPEYRNIDLCTGCIKCVNICPSSGAIVFNKSTKKVDFFHDKCIGCADCIIICPESALKILWNESSKNVQEKMIETCYGILKNKKDKVLYFNFLLDITPDCDCMPLSDNPFAPNIGVVASYDIIAIDQASADLVNKYNGLPNSKFDDEPSSDPDKFHRVWPGVDWTQQLDYGESLGLGTRNYELIEIE